MYRGLRTEVNNEVRRWSSLPSCSFVSLFPLKALKYRLRIAFAFQINWIIWTHNWNSKVLKNQFLPKHNNEQIKRSTGYWNRLNLSIWIPWSREEKDIEESQQIWDSLRYIHHWKVWEIIRNHRTAYVKSEHQCVQILTTSRRACWST